jgi:hypothetical protein
MPPPNELRYVEGRPIPAGYHLETRPRKGLLISGPIIFGVPYLFSMSVAASSRYSPDQWLYAPVVGPFIDLASRKNDCDSFVTGGTSSTTTCPSDSGTRFLLMVDGIMQVAGATMFVLGLALPQHLLVRDDAPYSRGSGSQFAWTVTPTKIGPTGYGLGAVGTF